MPLNCKFKMLKRGHFTPYAFSVHFFFKNMPLGEYGRAWDSLPGVQWSVPNGLWVPLQLSRNNVGSSLCQLGGAGGLKQGVGLSHGSSS